MVREAHHCARGVAPDARKAAQLVQRVRKDAAGSVRDPKRRRVEPPATNLVPQRVGDGLDLGQRCPGECGDRRISPEEAFIDGQDARDLRLVREYFGYEAGVRMSGPPPGQLASAGVLPGDVP